MFARKKPYYHIDDAPKKSFRLSTSRRLSALLVVVLFAVGVYGLVLLQSPELLINHASAATRSAEDEYVSTNRNFLEVQAINLVVPFAKDNSPTEKTVWQHNEEAGNPERGGNFILTAQRFKLGLTPTATKDSSPFYNLDKLHEKDTIKVYYNTKWYTYEVTRVYSAGVNDEQVEAPSAVAKLTLFASAKDNKPDYGVVVEAKMTAGAQPATSSGSLAPLL